LDGKGGFGRGGGLDSGDNFFLLLVLLLLIVILHIVLVIILLLLHSLLTQTLIVLPSITPIGIYEMV
jgi:hypothetical protein